MQAAVRKSRSFLVTPTVSTPARRHLFGRFMSQICIRVWDRKAVGEHDRAPALEARRRGRRTTLHFVSIRHSAWPSPDNGPAQGAFQDVRWPAARRSAGGEARGLAGLWGHERGRV